MRPGLRPENLNLKPEKPNLRPERPGLRPEKLDLRPERPNLRSQRPDLRPEGPDGGEEQTNKRTNGRTKVPLCSIGLRPLRGRCPKTGHLSKSTETSGCPHGVRSVPIYESCSTNKLSRWIFLTVSVCMENRRGASL